VALTSLRRSSSVGSRHDAARAPLRSGAGGRHRSISAVGARAAVNQLYVAAVYWLSIDGTDRRTYGQTDGHRTVT